MANTGLYYSNCLKLGSNSVYTRPMNSHRDISGSIPRHAPLTYWHGIFNRRFWYWWSGKFTWFLHHIIIFESCLKFACFIYVKVVYICKRATNNILRLCRLQTVGLLSVRIWEQALLYFWYHNHHIQQNRSVFINKFLFKYQNYIYL